ncbi:MAG: hypothetical protein WBQ17_09770 [Rhizomicrobium sp.]
MRRFVVCVLAASCAALPAFAARRHAAPADCSLRAIPDAPAQGRVGGKDFQLGGATLLQTSASANGANYDNYLLTLATPDGAGSTMTIVVTVSVPQGQTLDGKTFRRALGKDIAQQPQAGPGQAQIPDWAIDYASPLVDLDSVSSVASIKLEFGARSGTTLPAKIYFCAPDAKSNVFYGKFTVGAGG